MAEITFAQFMERRLYGTNGYYANQTGQSGRDGDYFTAVEAGEAFGLLLTELLAAWQEQSGFSPFDVVEVGAGEGKLARALGSALRKSFSSRADRFRYIAIERAPARRELLAKVAPEMPCPFEVFPDLDALAGRGINGCVVANELIDAFPVHRVRRSGNQLQEGFVPESGAAAWAWRQPSTPRLQAYFDRLHIDLPEGYETEVNLAMADWLKSLGSVVRSGLVVLFDYGRAAIELFDPERSSGTLRGFKDHRVIDDVLVAPPGSDITADVDFTSLALDAREAGFEVAAFSEMGSFLLQGAERWIARNGATAAAPSGLRYLLHPEGMGGSFQALILSKGVPFTQWSFPHNRLGRLGLSKK